MIYYLKTCSNLIAFSAYMAYLVYIHLYIYRWKYCCINLLFMLAVFDLFVVGNITCCVVGRCKFNIGVKIGFYASGFFLNIYDLY